VRGDPEPDPEVVRSVEEKLRGLGILRDRDRERNQLAEQEEKGVLEELGERGRGWVGMVMNRHRGSEGGGVAEG
jgi:hypothetical protein